MKRKKKKKKEEKGPKKYKREVIALNIGKRENCFKKIELKLNILGMHMIILHEVYM